MCIAENRHPEIYICLYYIQKAGCSDFSVQPAFIVFHTWLIVFGGDFTIWYHCIYDTTNFKKYIVK